MAWKLLKTRTMPIGVDLGTAVVKIAQLRSVEADLELTATASAEIPPDCRADADRRMAFLAGCLRDLLRAQPFKGRQCAMSLPAAETSVQHVKTAKMPPAELNQALRWELKDKLPFDPADAVIRHVTVAETYAERDGGLEVIVVAAAREAVERHLMLARKCHLAVTALNVEPVAILDCFARLFRRAEDRRRVALFLDLGQACTQVVISHGVQLVFARNLMVGARELEAAAAEALGCAAEEIRAARAQAAGADEPTAEGGRIYAGMDQGLALIEAEVTKCLRYYESLFPARPVDRLIFLGGQAQDRQLCQKLAQRLNLPAQIGDPLMRIGTGGANGRRLDLDCRHPQPAWAVAVGLSLGALGQAA